MTITLRIAVAGEKASFVFSKPNLELEKCIDIQGNPIHDKLIQALNCDYINCGSTDSAHCLAIGATILTSFATFMKSLDEVEDVTDKEDTKDEKTFGPSRNMKKGKFGFCRIYIYDNADNTISVKVRYDNPKKVVGPIYEGIRYSAITICRVALNVAEQYKKSNSTLNIAVKDYPGCDGVVKEAEEINRRNELIAMREKCPHLRSEFCVALEDGTPPRFDCELYCKGKCKNPKASMES